MRIGFLITARLKSSRLPMKLLKDLSGRAVVERVIDRAKQIAHIDDIVVCTSDNPQDRPLVDIARREEIYYFNGDSEDVLNRLLKAAEFYELDYFIGITGENPLFSIEYANQMAEQIRSGRYDFVYINGLPLGTAVYGVRVDALKVVCRVKEVVDTEIWGVFLNQPEVFEVCKIDVKESWKWPSLRITIDYPEDYEFVKTIFENVPSEDWYDFGKIMNYLKANPQVTDIHKSRTQAALDPEVARKVSEYYSTNKEQVLQLKKELYSS